MTIQSYPHVDIRVEDNSIYEPVPTQTLPLFRPLMFLSSQKGPIQTPVWQTFADARKTFGEKTFDPTSTYFSREAKFLSKIFENSGSFIVRLAPDQDDDEAATAAAMVVEAHVLEKDLPVYVTNDDGERVLATDTGLPIDTGETVAGVSITWTVRPLATDEEVDDITSTYTETVVDGVGTYKSYPMMVFYTTNPGAWGNNTGMAFYYDHTMNDPDQVARIGGPLYTMAPVEQDDGVTGAIRDVYNNIRNRFMMKPNVTDEATMAPVSFDNVISAAYEDGLLPYTIRVFNTNFKAIGDLYITKAQDLISWTFADDATEYTLDGDALAEGDELVVTDATGITEGMAVNDAVTGIPLGTEVESVVGNTVTLTKALTETVADGTTIIIDDPTNAQIPSEYTDGYEINIVGGIDATTESSIQRNYYYMNVESSNDALLETLNGVEDIYSLMRPIKDLNYYLDGGDDGTFADGGFEAKMVAFLNGTLINPDGSYADLEDASRYPFNYLYDTGYALDTKEELIAFQAIRGDVRSSIAAYIVGEDNDKLTNISTGRYLRDFATMILESEEKGTQGCRTKIFAQSGHLVGDTDLTAIYPATIWDAYKHAQYQNRTFLDQKPAGLPNSICDMFDTWNWVPSAEETKRRLWNDGLNYSQYYNMTGIHYPSIRTVYSYETSVLVNDFFVDAIVYTKQIMRSIWHEYVGTDMPFAILAATLKRRITDRLSSMFNGLYKFTPDVYQTEEEQNLGFVTHIRIDIESPATSRVHIVDIVANRENYEG
jgi:hypothetical protein